MTPDTRTKTQDCICLAVRQAARHVTQSYHQFLAPAGMRTTQFSILAKLKRKGPMTINALAAELVMDRTTLGRNILPLERDGLISIEPLASDRRSKVLHLTKAGDKRLEAARTGWVKAQARFESAFGSKRTSRLARAVARCRRERARPAFRGTHVTINALPDAAAAVQAPHVVCGEEVTVRPARPQDTGMIGAYIRALFCFAPQSVSRLGE